MKANIFVSLIKASFESYTYLRCLLCDFLVCFVHERETVFLVKKYPRSLRWWLKISCTNRGEIDWKKGMIRTMLHTVAGKNLWKIAFSKLLPSAYRLRLCSVELKLTWMKLKAYWVQQYSITCWISSHNCRKHYQP